MPPEGAFLPFDCEPVRVARAGPDRALGHELRPVGPARPHLANAMPKNKKSSDTMRYSSKRIIKMVKRGLVNIRC